MAGRYQPKLLPALRRWENMEHGKEYSSMNVTVYTTPT